jgi:regulator of sirC expression with transglutaminase-like and TPR domain
MDDKNLKEIFALVRLIDEPDQEIYKLIREKILTHGIEAVSFLEKAWDNDPNKILQERLEEIIHTIQYNNIQIELKKWKDIGSHNLLLGYILITKYQYPEFDEEKIRLELDRIKQDIWLELNDELTGFEKVKIINRILFDLYKFEGNTANMFSPINSYLINLLETKKGNQISLSLLYLILSQLLNLPVYGVNLPEHFVLAYMNEFCEVDSEKPDSVIFYINPYSKGIIFTSREIDIYLKQLKIDPVKSYYLPCSNIDIIIRLLKNLIFSYEKLNQKSKVEELEGLVKLLES